MRCCGCDAVRNEAALHGALRLLPLHTKQDGGASRVSVPRREVRENRQSETAGGGPVGRVGAGAGEHTPSSNGYPAPLRVIAGLGSAT